MYYANLTTKHIHAVSYLQTEDSGDETSDESDSSDNSSDSTDTNDSRKDYSSSSCDSEYEEWEDCDRNEFITELSGREAEKRENISKLPLKDNSSNGKLVNLITWMFYFIYLWKCVNVISDNALNTLLYFLYSIFQLMSLQDQLLAAALHVIPTSVYMLRRFLLVDRDNFERFIVCPKCTKVYKRAECFTEGNTLPELLHCNNIMRKTKRRTTHCNQMMFRKVFLKGGDEAYYPLKTYCFKSLIESLEDLLCRPGYEELCEHWRSREKLAGYAYDVYDGDIWQSFQTVKGRDFLAKENSYCFQLNIDWFQPFSRRKDVSVGVIYMCLLNLPLNLRYKRENIFILGIIPALNKEPATLQHFLQPVVTDLKYLWKGVRVSTSNKPGGTDVRAALICCTADIPALRKLCGFMGHSAALGCSKCLKRFPGGFGVKNDYSGFDRETWPKRLYSDHLKSIKKINKCKSQSARADQERLLGWRFTPLTELEYFDSVKHHVIDPMHNLFLGTAKRMFKLWIEKDILTKEKLNLLDSKLREFKISGDFGRLPNNISANWGGFTADQWKTWTLVYSLYALFELIPNEHLKIWHTFVTACRKIISPVVSYNDARLADMLFLKFGREAERLYGNAFITPNMHLHCHLFESVQRFGSVFAFWLFSFERFNGMLGSYNTNGRENFEVQLMREFLVTGNLLNRSLVASDDEHSRVLLPIVESMSGLVKVNKVNFSLKSWTFSMLPMDKINDWSDFSLLAFDKKKKQVVLDQDDLSLLQEAYKMIYSGLQISNMALTVLKYKSIHVNGQLYSSKNEHRGNYTRVLANWINDEGEIDCFSTIPKPGTVKFYFLHFAEIDGIRKQHCFANIEWHKPYLNGTQYPNPVSTWYKFRYFRGTSASNMPVQRIYARFAGVESKHNSSEVLITCPLYKRIENMC